MAKTWAQFKDPQEIRDFGIDWAAAIGTKTITASTWSVVAGTVVIDSDDHTTTNTTVRLSGGTVGETCQLLNHVTLSDGEEYEQTGQVKVKQR
ncbi:hypothetical protein [Mesorhizobium sp.]|uniref:phage fiber-tail adaptor protein n=1 Tax=Mesorhizobium sp. TaxID=1871066 RepID=UPI000FE54D99|nr:hypothetical protein [Mesorhizobium sp.]RWB66560.1 MAG: hypothetical protein EOQ49_28120 [Mesorhizobium sp.]